MHLIETFKKPHKHKHIQSYTPFFVKSISFPNLFLRFNQSFPFSYLPDSIDYLLRLYSPDVLNICKYRVTKTIFWQKKCLYLLQFWNYTKILQYGKVWELYILFKQIKNFSEKWQILLKEERGFALPIRIGTNQNLIYQTN